MELYAPKYYKSFRCIADRCTHSCCVGWEIDIDEQTLQGYRALEGEIGNRIRASISQGSEGAFFAMCPDGRCPHLDERGLCRIISALGEGYLCDICAEHPRFYNEVKGRLECGVGASCEEAARLILSEADYTTMVYIEGERETACDERGGGFDALAARTALFAVLAGAEPLPQRLARIRADFGIASFLPPDAVAELLGGLEYLDGAHRALLLSCALPADATAFEIETERFLAYLIYRHASPEVSEQGFRTAVSMALLLAELFAVMVCQKSIAPVRAARILSEEIEYCEENTVAIRAALSAHEM